MNGPVGRLARCAIYTRKSTEHNLHLAFNSLDAQREACEAYIKSQAHEGWRLMAERYDDGGLSGASLERPAVQGLLADVRVRRIDIVVVYKVDRLTRSLADFAKLIELFDAHAVSFVSVTQSFNTSSSMGRLTLNVLLSFAQFERELIGERVRDGALCQGRQDRPVRRCRRRQDHHDHGTDQQCRQRTRRLFGIRWRRRTHPRGQ
jgi:site-specific DNA recombinase